MIAKAVAVCIAGLFAMSAGASEYDDVSYGEIPRATFGAELIRPNGVTGAGSEYDDTQYASPAEVASVGSRTGMTWLSEPVLRDWSLKA